MKKVVLVLAVIFVAGGFFLYRFNNGLMGMYLAHKWANAYPIVSEPLVELREPTVAPSGQKLSYSGVEFAVPWKDFDGAQERSAPEDVTLTFRSGIKMRIVRAPLNEFVSGFTPGNEHAGLEMACSPERSMAFELVCRSWQTSPRSSEAIFGKETTESDYVFLKRVFEATPDKIDRLRISSEDLQRDAILLAHKGAMMADGRRFSLFSVAGPGFKGFQEGSPKTPPTGVSLMLFDEQGAVYIDIGQKTTTGTSLSQADINLIVQTLRRTATEKPTTMKNAAAS